MSEKEKLLAEKQIAENMYKILLEQEQTVQAQRIEFGEKINKIQNKLDTLEIKEGVDWEWLLFEDGYGSSARSKELDERLKKLGLERSGYYPNINQKAIRISITKEPDNTSLVHKGLEEIIPFIKHIGGVKRLGIMSNDLSSSGILELRIINTQFKLVKTVYGREYDLKEFNSLKEALLYIRDNYWYGEPYEDSSYQED